jgi:hypothetical protein
MKACKTPYCRNKPGKGRRTCNTCTQRAYREKYPILAAYNNLKHNAKRRGKTFDLTLEQFTKFAVETEYLNKRGRNKTGYTIDRINPNLGYTIENIQVLTNSDNVKKQAYIDSHWNGQEMEFKTFTPDKPNKNSSSAPF